MPKNKYRKIKANLNVNDKIKEFDKMKKVEEKEEEKGAEQYKKERDLHQQVLKEIKWDTIYLSTMLILLMCAIGWIVIVLF